MLIGCRLNWYWLFCKRWPCDLDAVEEQCGQATKGIRWMTWRAEAMKVGVASDMLRGVGKQTMIRRLPNGETHSRPAECIGGCERTLGTESSQYLSERKEKSIPSGVASERGIAQTGGNPGVAGLNVRAAWLSEALGKVRHRR
jgi:hypothetical protein